MAMRLASLLDISNDLNSRRSRHFTSQPAIQIDALLLLRMPLSTGGNSALEGDGLGPASVAGDVHRNAAGGELERNLGLRERGVAYWRIESGGWSSDGHFDRKGFYQGAQPRSIRSAGDRRTVKVRGSLRLEVW